MAETIDTSVYEGLRDVLRRQPAVTTVTYRPNSIVNCGWHRDDDDHPELGSVHFQYEGPSPDERGRKPARFAKSMPTEILWSALDELCREQLG
ncbi:hypothetical protein GCM10009060_27020 [Halorubrum trapanicum]